MVAHHASRRTQQTPVELLQRLLQFDTTNPPGGEAECIAFIAGLLEEAGIAGQILARDVARPNLVARLPGRGEAPPLLLYGHADVVSTAHQVWRYPPFSGTVADGYIWGRGALDMKGGLAIMLAALLRAQAEEAPPPGDVIFAVVSDEENGSDYGARFLVEQHADRFAGVRYALGEFGGFPVYLGGRKFYTIMVGEKQVCSLRVTFRGPGGHGSLPQRGGAMARLGRFLTTLDAARLPVHVTPVVRQALETIGAALPPPLNALIPQALDPTRTGAVLDALGAPGVAIDAILHNTVNATLVRGGEQINVIPSAVSVDLDGRLLPGFGPADLQAELQALAGPDLELSVLRYDPGPGEADLGLFATLAASLCESDPAAVPVPFLLAGVTDGRLFARLGIRTYGFLPMDLPPDFNYMATIHAADERVPVAAVDFGAAVLYRVLQRFGAAS